jgi:hypothetical protein
VVITADSECLIKGMTEKVLRTSRGEVAKNAELFRKLQTIVQTLNALSVGRGAFLANTPGSESGSGQASERSIFGQFEYFVVE